MKISPLQLITQEIKSFHYIDQVKVACENGADWIQLRVKNTSYDDFIKIAKESVELCKVYGTKLIVNDNVQAAMESKADGVHLGNDDMPIHSARKLLGEDKIIGSTGNSLQDLMELDNMEADYVMLGPFRFTPTKMNLKHLLGTKTYVKYIQTAREKGLKIPIIAVGGIKLKDVKDLFEIGVNGIAVSSAVFSASSPGQAIQGFLKNVNNYSHTPKMVW